MKQQNIIMVITGTIIYTLYSCRDKTSSNQKTISNSTVEDTSYHGYNELANPDQRESFTISDFNTDNPEVKNIERPSETIVKTSLDTSLLFSIWTSDPDGPHADFVFSAKSFYVVDYDGDGDMPYILTDKSLKIYYNDFIQEGEIISVDNENLTIKWKEFENNTKYVKWKN